MAIQDYSIYEHPLDDYVHEPYDAINMDYIREQIVARHYMQLKTGGELFQLHRRKVSGTRCDNPDCGASKILDDFSNSADKGCLRCLGTGFIDGYDYLGEFLARFPMATQELQYKPGGVMALVETKPWTMAVPIVNNLDIITALTRERYVEEYTEEDEELSRRIDNHANFDALSNTNVTKIVKITDETNSPDVKYAYGTDYVLSNNGILWISTNRPADMEAYYVTYMRTEVYIRRYRVGNIQRPSFRGVITHQKFDITEMDRTDPLYTNLPVVETWDSTYYLYPFPVDDWYTRV